MRCLIVYGMDYGGNNPTFEWGVVKQIVDFCV